MIKLNVKVDNQIKGLLKKQKTQIDQIPRKAFKVYEQNTPIRSGFARRNTKLARQRIIEANYPYAKRLDEGWSKQSPQGMTEPTLEFIEKEFLRIMSGK